MMPVSTACQSAIRTLTTEKQGLEALIASISSELGQSFDKAVTCLINAKGRVIVSGMGKSGHVGRKIAATLASTGTPAYFVHPGEASHGDLGTVQPEDVIIALSWSGETSELSDIISYAKRFRVPLIGMTAHAASSLGREADIALVLPKAQEACPNGLAPTTSTTMQLALGDALAVALLENKGFSAHDFKNYHPGGKLGALLKKVGQIMHQGNRLPVVAIGTLMSEAILVQSEKGLGCILVTEKERLVGLITDGDLRRHMGETLLARTVDDIMTPNPLTITDDVLLGEALQMLESRKISVLIIAKDNKPIGLVHVLDLLRAGVA